MPFSHDHPHIHCISVHWTASHLIFKVYLSILCKFYRLLCIKIPGDQRFLTSPSGINNDAMVQVRDHVSPFWCVSWNSWSVSTWLLCAVLMLHDGWLEKCMNLQVHRCFLKLSVGVSLNKCSKFGLYARCCKKQNLPLNPINISVSFRCG